MLPASSGLPRSTTGRWQSVLDAVACARPRQPSALAWLTPTLSRRRRSRPRSGCRGGGVQAATPAVGRATSIAARSVCGVAQTAADGGRGGGGDGGSAQALSPLPPPHGARPQHGSRRPRRHPRLLAGCRSATLDHSRARHCRVRVCVQRAPSSFRCRRRRVHPDEYFSGDVPYSTTAQEETPGTSGVPARATTARERATRGLLSSNLLKYADARDPRDLCPSSHKTAPRAFFRRISTSNGKSVSQGHTYFSPSELSE